MLTPPRSGATDQTWTTRALPPMRDVRFGGCGCVMSDGRYAFLGGTSASSYAFTTACEALVLRRDQDHDGNADVHAGEECHAASASGSGSRAKEEEEDHWVPLPPMLEARCQFACVALRGCIIVAGGMNRASAEVYEVGPPSRFRL